MSGGGFTEVLDRALESHFIEEQPNYKPLLLVHVFIHALTGFSCQSSVGDPLSFPFVGTP